MKASLNNYRQAPRKVRLVADLVRGKTAGDAIKVLHVTPKRATAPMLKLIESALANAKSNGVTAPESLVIKMIQVNKGVTLKRMMPRARGNAARINKRSSHVTLELGEKTVKVSSKKTAVKK